MINTNLFTIRNFIVVAAIALIWRWAASTLVDGKDGRNG